MADHAAKSNESQAAPNPDDAVGFWLPKWSLVVLALMLAFGAYRFALREQIEQGRYYRALNEATLTVENTDDGLGDNYALTAVQTNSREFLDLLGLCHSKPEAAQTVYRRLMSEGSDNGRVLACKMAFFLAQEGKLTGDDLTLLLNQLQPTASKNLRCVAQTALSDLLALTAVDKKNAYESLPAKTTDVKREQWKAEAAEADHFGRKYLTIRWSTPEACHAWVEKFGAAGATFDENLKRFAVAPAGASNDAPAEKAEQAEGKEPEAKS